MTWWQILLIILAVILVLLVVLYFVGSKMQRKTGRFSRADGCDETNAIHVNYRQKENET